MDLFTFSNSFHVFFGYVFFKICNCTCHFKDRTCSRYNLILSALVFVSEIGDIAGVADVTIRQSYRLIYPRAPDLFPADFRFDTPVDKLPQL